MKKSRQIILNLIVLILMVLNPLSSYSNAAVQAQSISDSKSIATVDVIARIIWEGGPELKPELWLRLMRQDGDMLEEVPGILPKQITVAESTASWFGLPKYNADGHEFIYMIQQGIWDAYRDEFKAGIPEGYLAVSSFDGLTIRNIYMAHESQPPADTTPPAIEPKETEPPVTDPEPIEEPVGPVEEPVEPIEEPVEEPVEEPTDPVEPPADDIDPIELPVITPEPENPPVEEPPLISPVTVNINWQGGVLPRPAFWLKLKKIDAFGNTSDVPGTAPIQANLATSVTWANFTDFNQSSDYTVAVVDSAGGPYTLPDYITTIDGLNVTFIFEEQNTIDIIANIEWLTSVEPKQSMDFGQYPGYRTPTVFLRLYRQANENEVPVALLSTALVQLAHGSTTAVWHDMPVTAGNGTPYIYRVKQVDADGNDFSPEGFQKIENGLSVQNVVIPGEGGPGTQEIIDPETPTDTYVFYNGATVLDTQIVKEGDTLYAPEISPVDENGQPFTGWYIGEGDTAPLLVLPKVMNAGDVTGDLTINVYARFNDYVYVKFYDTQETPPVVIKTKQLSRGATTDDSDVPLILEEGKALDYWSTSVDGTPFDFAQEITSDTDLYAVLKDAWKVTFFSQGGSSVLPQYVNDGEMATPPSPAPSRMGYSFNGWTTDAAGTSPYNFGTAVTANLTLYAQWTPQNASYVVVYWQENAEDDGYTFFELEEKTGPSGSPASYTPKSYTGFYFSHRDNKTIAGNGSTVENVYYKRNVWTLTIEYRTGSSWNYTWHTFSTTSFKYGQSTAPAYNAAVTAYPYYRWCVSRTSNTAYSEAPAMPNQNLTISGKYAGSTRWTIKYHEFGTSTSIKDDYVFYGSTGPYYFTEEDGIDIPGFTVTPIEQWEPLESGSPARTGIIYYTRNNYDITFNHNNPGSGPGTWLDRPYQSDISGALTYSGLTAGAEKVVNGVTYTFTGNWFENPACQGTAYNFTGATMPAQNLVFYAEWLPEPYTFTAYDPEGNVVPGTPVNVLPGGTVDPADLPAGYVWYWYMNGVFVPYDFERPIYEDVEVYAVSTTLPTYTVTYDANGGTGAPTDDTDYLSGQSAILLGAPTGAPADKPVFLGWALEQDGSGDIYQPGNTLIITGNVTLYAQWGVATPHTTVIYKPNYPAGYACGDIPADSVYDVENNGNHILRSQAETFLAPIGYTFKHWQYKMKGSDRSRWLDLDLYGQAEVSRWWYRDCLYDYGRPCSRL